MRELTMLRRVPLALVLLTVLEPGTAVAEPGWYRVDLEKGCGFTARLLGEEGAFYLLSYEGAVLRVEKGAVRRLARVEAEPEEPAGGEPPAGEEAGREPARREPASADRSLEESLRDAIETLASLDEAAVDRSYDLIAKEIATARPMVHLALSHRHPRVRALATKVLGEMGVPEKDLAAAAARLSDKKPEVRLAAVMAVRALGPAALPQLVECLAAETVPNNRKMAVKTLELWEDARAVAPLAGRLAQEEDEGVREFIACALESLTGQRLGADAEAWAAYLIQAKRDRELEAVTRATVPGRPAVAPGGKTESKE
jgi:HEAT repeats